MSRRVLGQLLQECFGKASALKHKVLVLLCVDQASGAVVAEDEVVSVDDSLPAHVLRVVEVVTDHFEHDWVGGPGEHDHHHAPVSLRDLV